MRGECIILHDLRRLSGNQPKPIRLPRVVDVQNRNMRRMRLPRCLDFRAVDTVEPPDEAEQFWQVTQPVRLALAEQAADRPH